jgi:hypothetical protein
VIINSLELLLFCAEERTVGRGLAIGLGILGVIVVGGTMAGAYFVIQFLQKRKYKLGQALEMSSADNRRGSHAFVELDLS